MQLAGSISLFIICFLRGSTAGTAMFAGSTSKIFQHSTKFILILSKPQENMCMNYVVLVRI